jgi:hypothetical protein
MRVRIADSNKVDFLAWFKPTHDYAYADSALIRFGHGVMFHATLAGHHLLWRVDTLTVTYTPAGVLIADPSVFE